MIKNGYSVYFTVLLIFSFYHSRCQVTAVENESLGLNSEFSYLMLEPNQSLRKADVFLNYRKEEDRNKLKVIFGFSLIPILDYQKTNSESNFSYLMRHPTSNNQVGYVVSEAALHSMQFMIAGKINNWIAVYTELLYNPQQSFGTGTITSIERNQIQLYRGFVLLGDINKFPVYGAIGKIDAPFGKMGSVSPFTNSTMWHAFGGLGYGIQLGFVKKGFHATIMAVQGGAQFRGMHTPVGDSTNIPSKLNNFVGDLNYTFNIHPKYQLTAGASYLHGSAYCQDFPVTHFAAGSKNNPAFTYYGILHVNDRLKIQASFAETLEVWPGTQSPYPPLDVYEASKVSSIDYGFNYNFLNLKNLKYLFSAEFSNFRAGPSGAPWERQNQIIVGLSGIYKNSSRIFIEYFHTDGYAPLNFISGSDPFDPFPPGVTHCERDAKSNGIVIGAILSL